MKTRILLFFTLLYCMIIVAQKQFRDTIPFRNDLGLIIIPIKFNGVQKDFVFDTGATHSVGFSWVNSELTKTSKTIKVTSSSKKKSRLRYYKSDSVNLASAKITKHRILKTKDNDIFSCYRIDGVLGVDIIAQFNWVINYKEKYLVMYNNDFLPKELERMNAIDFEYINKRPNVFLNFGKDKMSFLLDTGATFSDIYVKNYTRIHNLDHQRKDLYTGSFDFNGKLSQEKSAVMKFSSIKSKDININGIFYFGKKSNKIGNKLWKDNSLFLSLKNNMLYTDKVNIQQSRIGYSCGFVYENNKIMIAKVIIGSKAWQQGLRQGDDIQKINGKTFEDFCSLYNYQTEMSRNDRDLTITLNNDTSIVLKKKTIL